ncbi:hypothetical protein QCA50_012165 [Cerrena zonata]|uniref:Cupin-like domain-containing protein n=1 Tax=Cerrena zonata TaxID=2478898 RepID=A0AAW0FTD3_9APHY
MTNAKRQKHLVNEYKGYTVPNNHTDIDVIEKFPENHDEWFFNNFIKLRKPAKIKSQCPINIDEFKFDKLKEKLQYQDKLQIEKKFNNGFGSGLQRELKTFDEILSIFENGDDSYYLTTQYNQEEPEEEEEEEEEEDDDDEEEDDDDEEEDDDDEEEDDDDEEEDDEEDEEEEEEEEGTAFSDTSSIGSIDMNNLRDDFDDCDDSLIDEKHQLSYADIQSRVKELLQPPLTNLYKDENFPLVPQFLSSLIPQQINLWMGNGKNTGDSIEDMDFDNLSLDEIGKRIPGNDLNKLQVWLKPGEQLYLPTGWFHEVSSFAQNELNPTHIAINYWFIPPTEFFFHTPYKDTYWQEDFDANKASIEHLKKGIVQL